jgi:GNAT superfamily N-acetyltransferase
MNNNVIIRKATEEEIDRLLEIWLEKAHWLIDTGKPMWDPTQFSRERLKDKYHKPEYYVCRNEKDIIGGFILIEYDERYWKDHIQDKAYYFHKFVVRSKYKGQGYSGYILEWVKKYGKEMGKDFVRLDYNEERTYLKEMYIRHGFISTDIVKNDDGDVLVIAEYKIK